MAIAYDVPSNTITVTGYSAVTPCTFEDVYQADVGGGWGVVTKQGTIQYFFDAKLALGDDNTATYFEDSGKQIVFNDGLTTNHWQTMIEIQAVNATVVLTLGELVNATEKSTKNGCEITSLESTASRRIHLIRSLDANGEVYLYSSSFNTPSGGWGLVRLPGGSGRAWNTLFKQNTSLYKLSSGYDAFNYTVCSTEWGALDLNSTNERFFFSDCTANMYFGAGSDWTFTNVKAIDTKTKTAQVVNFNNTGHIIDADVDNWVVSWFNSTGSVYRQYTVNIQLLDKDNNAIQATAAVRLLDVDGNITGGFTWIDTDVNGQITEQVASRGYCETGDTDLDSDLTKDYSDHQLEVKVSGYKSYKCKFTLDEKVDWRITLAKVLDMNISKRVGVFSQ